MDQGRRTRDQGLGTKNEGLVPGVLKKRESRATQYHDNVYDRAVYRYRAAVLSIGKTLPAGKRFAVGIGGVRCCPEFTPATRFVNQDSFDSIQQPDFPVATLTSSFPSFIPNRLTRAWTHPRGTCSYVCPSRYTLTFGSLA
jgi:hypothetical protein